MSVGVSSYPRIPAFRAYMQYKQVSSQISKAVRVDRSEYVNNVLAEGFESFHAHDLKHFYAVKRKLTFAPRTSTDVALKTP